MNTSVFSPEMIRRFKILSKFVSVQLVVQALGFASGIVIIRTLNKSEYAYFLIANTMQSTMDLMADLGITIGLNSIGGQVWNERYKLSQLISTAFWVRRYLIIISMVVITPILLLILINNGASLKYSLLLILAILIELQFYSTNKILGTIIRFQSKIGEIQRLDLITAGSRLTGLSFTYFMGLNAVIAAFCSTVSSGIHSFFLSQWVKDSIIPKAPINPDYQTKIWSLIKSQFLSTTFFCFQGQITIWLISIFGKTSSIAEVGALSRLGLIMTLLNSVMNSIVVPSYARCQSVNLLQRRYWQVLGVFLLIAGTLLSLVAIFPREVLWILGNQYTHLQNEVILMVASSLLYSLTAMIWSLNYAKAWVNESWLIIPSTIGTQLFLLLYLDVSTVKGVILFGLFSAIPPLLVNFYMSYKGLKLLFKL